MPVQDYNINTRDMLEGQLYGLQQTRADIQTVFAKTATGFGRAVQYDSGERTYALGAKGGFVSMVTLRQLAFEQTTRPGDGTIAYPVGAAMGAVADGRMTVRSIGGATVKAGQAVYVHETDGTFSVAAGEGFVAAKNVTTVLGGAVAAGDVIPVCVVEMMEPAVAKVAAAPTAK